MTPTWLLVGIFAAAPAVSDVNESRAAREIRLAPYVEAIAGVTSSPVEQRALRVLGTEETHWDSLVLAGRCDLLEKPTKVCDYRRGVYRARGAYQLHEGGCRAAFTLPPGSPETIRVETRCAIRQLRYHGRRCANDAWEPLHLADAERMAAWWVGAFAGYATGGASCDTAQARERARMVVR